MPTWRDVFRFKEGEDVEFSTVHQRYRERMMALNGAVSLDEINLLNRALNEARDEIGPTRRIKRPT